MCKHPCVCVDKHAGISNHTIWQRGKPSNGMEFSTHDLPRPNPPDAVEEMVRMVSKHLVEVVVGHTPGEGNANAQRRYNKLARFYVMWSPTVMNRTQLLAPTPTTMPSTLCTPSNKWSSVATWWQMGSCGFHPHRMPRKAWCQATNPLSGFKKGTALSTRTVVSCLAMLRPAL